MGSTSKYRFPFSRNPEARIQSLIGFICWLLMRTLTRQTLLTTGTRARKGPKDLVWHLRLQLKGFQGINKALGKFQGFCLTFMMNRHLQHGHKRRILKILTLLQLIPGKGYVILFGRHAQDRIFRIVGLKNNTSRLIPPPGSASRLCQKGKTALTAAKVRQVEGGISRKGFRQESHWAHHVPWQPSVFPKGRCTRRCEKRA